VNRPQRIVVIIAVGLATVAVVQTVNTVWFRTGGGWFGYAPNTSVTFEPGNGDGDALMRGLLWLVGVAGWAAIAVRLLRDNDS
jgi:hypothetical protein